MGIDKDGRCRHAKDSAFTKGRKLKAIEESLEWIRNNEVDIHEVDSPTVKSLSKLAGIAMPKKLTPENKKKTVENAIEWLRNAEPEDLLHVDNPTLESLTNLAGVAMPGISDADKEKALDKALDWLRNNDP